MRTLCILLLGITAMINPLWADNNYQKATFAGGCFWCMEPPFDKLDGVISTTSGYSGGDEVNPSYREVSSGKTGHIEVVQVLYDPGKVDYQTLLDVYWRQIDPTTPNQQFVDIGPMYRSAIFYHNEDQRRLAKASKVHHAQAGTFGHKPIVTTIEPAKPFYAAEEYHQDYYLKNPVRYKFYRSRSGRDQYLERIWGKDHH